MKKIFLILNSALLALNCAIAQTFVTGGIYSNDTWTLANSPYIVTDTVTVYPNVTLTIQPGVIVKFNSNGRLWIKQGSLLAQGTSTDSITFTSNAVAPAQGDWDCIYLGNNPVSSRFNYCNIMFSAYGISHSMDAMPIRNTQFLNNGYGIYYSASPIDSCTAINNGFGFYAAGMVSNSHIANNQEGIKGITSVSHCTIDSNSIHGIYYISGGVDSIIGCQVRNNAIGIAIEYGTITIHHNIMENNAIGLQLESDPYPQNIFCNKICNNTSYDLKYLNPFYNINVANNFWCTTDSLTIASHIYDGYDNPTYQLVTFTPADSLECYIESSSTESVFSINEKQFVTFNISPNPFTIHTTITFSQELHNATFSLYNLLGEKVTATSGINGESFQFKRGNLSSGVYVFEVVEKEKIVARSKVVIY